MDEKKGPYPILHKTCKTITKVASLDGDEFYCAHCQTRRPKAEFKKP